MNTKTKQMDLRPIATIARKYAKKSHQVGHFSMSEGYEIVRLCWADKVKIRFNAEAYGSSFNADPRPESVAQGRAAIVAIAEELRQSGYEVQEIDHLVITVRNLK